MCFIDSLESIFFKYNTKHIWEKAQAHVKSVTEAYFLW